ncbi:MAG: rRNA adenine N-6-methyltransferase family protein [Pseudomonadota bacterium]
MNYNAARHLTFELEGVVIHAPADVVTPAIATALSNQSYEAEEARIVRKALRAGDRVLEVGSGLGFITALIGQDERCSALTAVEADPRLARRVKSTVSENCALDIDVLNGVLTSALGEAQSVPFYQRRDFWMSSMIETDVPADLVVRVPLLDFNTMLRERRITMLVCDIEGAEVDLFRHADFAGVDRIVVELHDHVNGLKAVSGLIADLADKGFGYDPRCSEGSVVTFRKFGSCEDKRPYGLV